MQLSPGQTYLLKSTRERIRLIADASSGMWIVEETIDNERFTVHEDDLEPIIAAQTAYLGQNTTNQNNTVLPIYPYEGAEEVQLAFLAEGEIDFSVKLLNYSKEPILFSTRLTSKIGQQFQNQGVLPPTSSIEVGKMYRDVLNENGQVEIETSRKSEQGTDNKQHRLINLKPKLFFKKITNVSWHDQEVSIFPIFKTVIPEIKPKKKAKKVVVPAAEVAPKKQATSTNSLYTFASFPTEIDLHIEALVEDPKTLRSDQILSKQLNEMRSYIDRAIRFGVERVYLIHGTGSGVLKRAIHDHLEKLGDIEMYNNDFHPKYHHGATEVVLRF